MKFKTETAVGIFILVAIGAFVYMVLQIGVFRFDKAQYSPYTAYFKDAGGLTRKTDVKIAGVKVGWVDSVDLLPETNHVKTRLMLQKDFILHNDAKVSIRQDGLLGVRFIEIIPGQSDAVLAPGTSLADNQCISAASLDELILTVQKITKSVQAITGSLESAISNNQNQETLKNSVESIGKAAQNLSKVTDTVNNLLKNQQDNLSKTLENIRILTEQVSQRFPDLSDSLKKTLDQTNKNITQTTKSIHKTSEQINNLAANISKEPGALGKLLCGEERFTKLDQTLTVAQSCAGIIKDWSFGAIGHVEALRPLDSSVCSNNIKTYLNFQWNFLPQTTLFAGLTTNSNGYAKKKETLNCSTGEICNIIKRHKSNLALNLQLGQRFGQFGIRAGIFESTPGVALDYMLDLSKPFENSILKPGLTSSFEIFDWRGNKRFYCDNKPHLKWLNRLWLTPELFIVGGIDDIASRARSGFVGAGFNYLF